MMIKYILKGLGLYYCDRLGTGCISMCKFVNLEFSHTQMNNLDQDNEDQEEGEQ